MSVFNSFDQFLNAKVIYAYACYIDFSNQVCFFFPKSGNFKYSKGNIFFVPEKDWRDYDIEDPLPIENLRFADSKEEAIQGFKDLIQEVKLSLEKKSKVALAQVEQLENNDALRIWNMSLEKELKF